VPKIASLPIGGPARPIAEIAKQEDADLIVVGTRGHAAATGILVGGVTNGCSTSRTGRSSPFHPPSSRSGRQTN
jgi:Universal stress protein family